MVMKPEIIAIFNEHIFSNRIKREGKLKRHLIRSAFGSFVNKIASTVLVFLSTVILARFLGPDGFGRYAFCISLITILSILATLGFPMLAVREIPAFQTQKNFGLLRGFITRILQAAIIISFIIIIIIFLLGQFKIIHLDMPYSDVFWLALLLLLPLNALINLAGASLRGLQYIISGQVHQTIRFGLFILLLLLCISFSSYNLSPFMAMVLFLIATGITAITVGYLLVNALSENVKQAEPAYETRKWIFKALPLLMAMGITILNNEISVIMLGVLGEVEDVGLFRVAQRGAELVMFGLVAVNMTIAPTISSLYTTGQMEKLQQVITQSARSVVAYSLPVALFLILTGPWLVPFLFGEQYKAAVPLLAVLCIGQIINTSMGSVGIILNMTGNERLVAKGVTAGALSALILNLILIPQFGAMGAATATLTSMAIWNVLLAVWIYKKLGLTTLAFSKKI